MRYHGGRRKGRSYRKTRAKENPLKPFGFKGFGGRYRTRKKRLMFQSMAQKVVAIDIATFSAAYLALLCIAKHGVSQR